MELRHLRGFAAVAEHGTYADAAKSQHITQPAIWRQVKELERELGLSLFERHGRRVRPTTDGVQLLKQVTTVLATVERMASVAADLRSARAGVVAIACASPPLQRFLAMRIGQFRRAHPGVSVIVREYGGGSTPGRGIREDLLDGVVDLAAIVGMPDGSETQGFPIYDVRLVVAVPDEHPWRDEQAVEIAELLGQPLILTLPGGYSRTAIETACRRAGFEPLVPLTLASPVSQVALGQAGVGLPVAFDDSVGGDEARPWPMLVENGRAIGDRISLVWRAGAPLSPSVRAFVEICRDTSGKTVRAPSRRPRAERPAGRVTPARA